MIVSNFSRLSLPNFLAQAQRIVTAMTGNSQFPEPWPAPTPSLAQITADLNSFATAYSAVSSGDRTRLAERNSARITLAGDLQMFTNGDATLLATTGFDLRSPPPHTVVTVPPIAPADLRIDRGEVSGSLLVRVTKLRGASAYDVQVTSADPTVETNWSAAGTFVHCRRIEIDGLTPGKTYSVRVRAINGAGPGAWTLPGSLMVV